MSHRRPNLDWRGEIVPRVKQILIDRRDKGIPTATLRGIFYILVSLNVLENLQQRYKSLSKALVIARKNGIIPENWIVDESREIIDIYDTHFEPGQEITYLFKRLEKLPEEYIKSVPRWHNQTRYVEVWVEKNAMADVFSSILTKSRQVRIVPNGGWSSFSFESKNMRRLRYYQAMGKEVYVLYYGDRSKGVYCLHFKRSQTSKSIRKFCRKIHSGESAGFTQREHRRL